MITNGNSTVESLQYISSLLVIPRLFEEPIEGRVAWLLKNVADPRPISAGSIPDRIIRVEFEARYYSLLLPRILNGEYETELLVSYLAEEDRAAMAIYEGSDVADLQRISLLENLPIKLQWAATAKWHRLLFDRGRPLYIGVFDGDERYQKVAPVLTYVGYGQYVVGTPAFYHQFPAISHAAAVRMAQQWFFKQREEEIAEIKKIATTLRKKTPPLVLDVLTAVLQQDGMIIDESGMRLAWKNGGIHGRFGVAGPRWQYYLTCAPQTAVYFMLLGLQEAITHNLAHPLDVDTNDRVHEYFDLERKPEELVFAGGRVTPHPNKQDVFGVFSKGKNQPHMIISVNGLVEVQTSQSGRDVTILQSAIPQKTMQVSTWDCAAWGTWAGTRKIAKVVEEVE